MTDKKTSHLIDRLKNGQELSAEDRRQIIELLQLIDENNVRDKLFESLGEMNKVLVDSEHWKHLLQECFCRIGEGIEADRITYYEELADEETGQTGVVKRVEWQRDQSGEINRDNKTSFLSTHQFGDLFRSLENNEPVQFARSESSNKAIKDLFAADNVSSVLMLPIIVKDRVFGLLRFDDCRRKKNGKNHKYLYYKQWLFR